MKPKLTWKRNEAAYSNNTLGYCGKWLIGSVGWDFAPSDKALPIYVTCRLPGIKENLGNYADEETAKAKLVGVLGYWLGKLEYEDADQS